MHTLFRCSDAAAEVESDAASDAHDDADKAGSDVEDDGFGHAVVDVPMPAPNDDGADVFAGDVDMGDVEAVVDPVIDASDAIGGSSSSTAPVLAAPVAPCIPPYVHYPMPSAESMFSLPRHYITDSGKITFYKSGSFEVVCNVAAHGDCRQTRKGRMLRPLKRGQFTGNGHGLSFAFCVAWLEGGSDLDSHGELVRRDQPAHYAWMPTFDCREAVRTRLEASTDPRIIRMLECERPKCPGEGEWRHFE